MKLRIAEKVWANVGTEREGSYRISTLDKAERVHNRSHKMKQLNRWSERMAPILKFSLAGIVAETKLECLAAGEPFPDWIQ